MLLNISDVIVNTNCRPLLLLLLLLFQHFNAVVVAQNQALHRQIQVRHIYGYTFSPSKNHYTSVLNDTRMTT